MNVVIPINGGMKNEQTQSNTNYHNEQRTAKTNYQLYLSAIYRLLAPNPKTYDTRKNTAFLQIMLRLEHVSLAFLAGYAVIFWSTSFVAFEQHMNQFFFSNGGRITSNAPDDDKSRNELHKDQDSNNTVHSSPIEGGTYIFEKLPQPTLSLLHLPRGTRLSLFHCETSHQKI